MSHIHLLKEEEEQVKEEQVKEEFMEDKNFTHSKSWQEMCDRLLKSSCFIQSWSFLRKVY